ncbi:MAG: 3-oxoacid CoA-transferase subunit B [Vulcanimicrobiaceae bacterium]
MSWNDEQLACRIAEELEDGAVVNLGIGMPTMVARYVPAHRTIIFHSENGIIGMGPTPPAGKEDSDIVNAGKQPVTLITGAAIVHQADSFALIRSGRLDAVVLGGLQVAANGDLANWKVPGGTSAGGVGGAMDLVAGAKRVFVMMRHVDKKGGAKFVERCTYPLTGMKCVSLVFTDYGVFECRGDSFFVREIAPGIAADEVRSSVGAPVEFSLEPAARR